MSKKPSRWGAISEQTAKIADEGRQVGKTKPTQLDEATALQPQEVEELKPQDAVSPQPQEAVRPIPVKRPSTSLYLAPAAHTAIRVHAAKNGIKSNRIYEDALRAYFKEHDLGDFDELNNRAS